MAFGFDAQTSFEALVDFRILTLINTIFKINY